MLYFKNKNMKLTKINKTEIRKMNAEAARDAKALLSQKGARLSLVAAFVYITATAGAGLVASYMLLNFLDYYRIIFSDFAAYAFMFSFAFFFAVPSFAGARHISSAICDGREVSLGELFVAFSSFERFCAAYLGALALFLRYAVAAFIIYSPEFIEDMIFTSADEIPTYFYPLALIVVLLAAIGWLMLTRRLRRIFYFIFSRKMGFLKALSAAVKQKFISRGMFSANILNLFLSFATCFILFILHAGPLFTLESELSMRRQEKYIEQLKSEK